jgi:hypothetical protein
MKEHPHEIRTQPGVFSCAELRDLWRYLKSIGWPPRAIDIAFDLRARQGGHCAAMLRTNGKHRWIFPNEQARWSKTMRRILAGELTWGKVDGKIAVFLADDPKPLTPPQRWRYDLATGRMQRVQRPLTARPMMPSFASVFSDALSGKTTLP